VVGYQRVTVVGKRENTWVVRTREQDDHVSHLVDREGGVVINVGEKLFVRLLVAGGFRERRGPVPSWAARDLAEKQRL